MDSCPRNKDGAQVCLRGSSGLYHTKRDQGSAASCPWPGPTTWPSKPVSGETPSAFSCLHQLPSHSWVWLVFSAWDSRASDSHPTLPTRSLKETQETTPPGTFHAGEILSSSKDCLVSDFTTGRAQGYPLSRSEPGRRAFALSFITRVDRSLQLSSIYSAQFRCPA